MKKRALAFVLAALLVCTLFAFPASAAQRQQTRSASNYDFTSGGTGGSAYCEFILSENYTEGVQYVTARTSLLEPKDVNMIAGSEIRLRVRDGSTVLFDQDTELSAPARIQYITAQMDPEESNNALADHYVTTATRGSVSKRTELSWG